ncbi:hypothetical protein TWF281_002140 [Arthrobotrys megalospora]
MKAKKVEQRAMRRAAQAMFRNRKNSIIRKARELHSLCRAEVILLIRREGKIYTYRSHHESELIGGVRQIDSLWPQSEHQIEVAGKKKQDDDVSSKAQEA